MFFNKKKKAALGERSKGADEIVFGTGLAAPEHASHAARTGTPATIAPAPAAPTPAASAEPAPPVAQPAAPSLPSLIITDPNEFEGPGGAERAGVVIGEKLVLGPNQGRQSKGWLPVKAGDVFEFSTLAEVAVPAGNGHTNGFFAGPVFYNSGNEIVKWWEPQPGPADGETSREILIRSETPADAASVRVGVYGSWTHEGPPADFVLAFRSTKLQQV